MCLTPDLIHITLGAVETKTMRKVALTSEWDLIQLQDEEGPFAILFNVATYETREVQCREDLLAVLTAA